MTVIDARPPRTDLALWSGDAFALTVTITGADTWTPATATWTAQLRVAATGAIAAAFTCTWTAGALHLELTPTQTAALADLAAPRVDGWPFTWDLQADPDGSHPLTIARGMATVDRDTTRTP